MTFLQKTISIQPSERFTALIALNDPWLKDTGQMSCQASKSQEDVLHSLEIPLNTADEIRAVREHQTAFQTSDDKTSYQGSEFEEDATIRGSKNPLSLINDQTSDIIELTTSQVLNKSLTSRKALPLRPQDDRKQMGSQIALHSDIAPEHAIQDTHATQLLLKNGFDLCEINFNANEALL
jgi:hypothetical protein